MKKILTVSVLLVGMLLQSSFAGETKFYSFGEWVEMAAAKTGYKIVCPPELLELANQRESKFGEFSFMPVTPEEWKKFFASHFIMNCAEDSQNRTLALDVDWKTEDSASAAELLEWLWHSPGATTVRVTKLNALLSKACNYARAWKVRQMSFMSQMFPLEKSLPPRLVEKIVSRNGREYVLIITVQEIEISPGHGSMAWYLFDRKGVLVSADLVNTGHRCWFNSASMRGDNELQVVLNFNNNEKYGVNMAYAVEGDQLQPVQAINFDGNAEKLDSRHTGQSLMPK